MNGNRDHRSGQGDRRAPGAQRWASPRPPDVTYRLSDLERDEAIAVLGDAYAEGRLDHGEFEVRLEAASRAVLASDLDPLFADLPLSRTVEVAAGSASRQPAPVRTRGRHRPPFGALLFLFALAVVTHAWLLIPLALVMAGHRRRTWAPWSTSAPQPVGCRPHPGDQRRPWR